jgi:hypothetical protein
MYKLYLLWKSHGTLPTEDELKIAQGEKLLDPNAAADYIHQLEQASANIVDAFNKQVNKAFISISVCHSLIVQSHVIILLGRLESREI